jgi:hypothetical protein
MASLLLVTRTVGSENCREETRKEEVTTTIVPSRGPHKFVPQSFHEVMTFSLMISLLILWLMITCMFVMISNDVPF